jgi:hypothetical protein
LLQKRRRQKKFKFALKPSLLLLDFCLSLILSALSVVTVFPKYAFVIPPNPSGEDSKHELHGPHIQGIVIKLHVDITSEWTDMDTDHLDF